MSDWLARYQAGETEAVWLELRRLGPRVRDVEHLEEARSVCAEMAIRARYNVELLVSRLTADGYRFHSNDDERRPLPAHVPPSADVKAHISWLERTFGPLPLTLVAWIRHVGDVWLVGTHPGWEASSYADPLVLEADAPNRDRFMEDHAMWREIHGDPSGQSPPFRLDLAPDELHKANVSGGPPAGIDLPATGVDGDFGSTHTEPFVSYLNRAFRWGGFPGTEGGAMDL